MSDKGSELEAAAQDALANMKAFLRSGLQPPQSKYENWSEAIDVYIRFIKDDREAFARRAWEAARARGQDDNMANCRELIWADFDDWAKEQRGKDEK